MWNQFFYLSIYCSFWIFSNCQEINNIRGYLYYPDFGPNNYIKKKLEIIFDYDPINLKNGSRVEVECHGYKNLDNDCLKLSKCPDPDWQSNLTKSIKPYEQILFDIEPGIENFLCRMRLTGDSWTNFTFINPTFSGSTINPKPSLLICQTLNNPQGSYERAALIRGLAVESANVPNETRLAEFDLDCNNLEYQGNGNTASLWALYNRDFSDPVGAGPVCFDWISYWGYKINTTNENCITKFDTLGTKYDGIKREDALLDCFDGKVSQILCYAAKNMLFISILTSPGKYRLISYDLSCQNRTKRIIVDLGIEEPSCSRFMSHNWTVFDWRPYWTENLDGEANVVFISDGALWAYEISTGICQKILPLAGLTKNDRKEIEHEIVQFDLDWSYFYWINGSTYDIQTYSWSTRVIQSLEKVRIYDAEKSEQEHNLTEMISDDLKNIVSMVAYSPAMKPYPFLMDCLIPDLDIDLKMTTDTTAAMVVMKLWSMEEKCQRSSRPPLKMKMECSSENSESRAEKCRIMENATTGRNERWSTQLVNLVLGDSYDIVIHISHPANNDVKQIITKSFLAEFPPSNHWWHYFLIAISIFVVILSILLTFYFGWYRKRKAIQDFLRRERIDASQLKLVRQLGEGEFGEVWLANYKKVDTDSSHNSQAEIEVALKMRKVNMVSYQSTLMSADCFFQEAVALNFLRHPNIVVAHGICTNYDHLPPILVLEYMNGGNCLDYIKSERTLLTNQDLIKICRDTLNACCHLTNMRVVHKDIGARNVLVRKHIHSGKPDVAKLTDFGLARDVGTRDMGYTSNLDKNTMFHVRSTAPEGFKGKFLFQSDVWSFGIFVWELYSLITEDNPIPYANLSPISVNSILEFLKSGGQLEKPSCAPSDVYLLMRQCWSYDPSDRPVFRQLNAAWRMMANHAMDQRPLCQIVSNSENANGVDEVELDHGNDGMTEDGYKDVSFKDPTQNDTNGYISWEQSMENKEARKPDETTKILFKYIGYQAPSL